MRDNGPEPHKQICTFMGAVHTKTDKAEDIGPNIVPVCVFVIMGGGGGRDGWR